MNGISLSGLNDAINSYKNIDLFKRSIILAWRGSVAHGTYIPKHIDDKDIMGIVVLPIQYYLGLENFGNRNTKTIYYNEWDLVFYELRKFMGLLLKSNPNLLSLLWLKDDLYIHISDEGKRLIENRRKFLSKRIYKSFVGYAYGQLKRMTHFRYEGYMGQKRKALVDEYGYDSKNAAHLIRLLKMGIEALETGELNVYREKDKDQIIQIKQGLWDFNKIKAYSENLFKKIEQAKDETKLPEHPDTEFAEELMIEILKSRLKLQAI